MDFIKKINKKFAIFSAILIIAFIIFAIYINRSNIIQPPSPTPTPTLTPITVPNTQETISNIQIGQNLEEVTSELGEPINQEASGIYDINNYNSELPGFNNKIYFQDETVVVTREQVNSKSPEENTISSLLPNPKTPPIIKYLPELGAATPVYIFPSDGLAFTAHNKDQTVFEVWRFSPTTSQIILNTWGSDFVDKEELLNNQSF